MYEEQQDVTLKMVISAGLIKPCTKVHAASDKNIIGVVNEDGSITLNINGSAKNFPYPSGAARAIRNISVSGWIFWLIKDNDQFIELLKYKQKFAAAKL